MCVCVCVGVCKCVYMDQCICVFHEYMGILGKCGGSSMYMCVHKCVLWNVCVHTMLARWSVVTAYPLTLHRAQT